jgi:polyisoprenoid-binding protein YceI
MTTAIEAIEALDGTYQADPVHSSFGFSVRHAQLSDFAGTLSDVSATLTADNGALALEGAAKADSISIREPAEFRAHVLGGEFFDVENHPEVKFRSTSIELGEDGRARIEGELTIRGVTREVTATGIYSEPRELGGSQRTGFELETTFDRRDYGFDWQMELPSGGDTLGWDVTLKVHLELVRQNPEG